MKIAIIWSGAIGCSYGAYLCRNNEILMLCRRQQTADSINKSGLTVFEPDNITGHYTENIRAAVSGGFSEVVDLAIVIVIGADTESSIRDNMKLIVRALIRRSRMVIR